MDWHSFLVGYICGYATVLTIWWIYVITEKRRIRSLIEEEEREKLIEEAEREGHAE